MALARLAGRERGAPFDGDLPAAPERITAIEQILSDLSGSASGKPSARSTARRVLVTRGGVTVGELWRIA